MLHFLSQLSSRRLIFVPFTELLTPESLHFPQSTCTVQQPPPALGSHHTTIQSSRCSPETGRQHLPRHCYPQEASTSAIPGVYPYREYIFIHRVYPAMPEFWPKELIGTHLVRDEDIY